MFTPEDRPVHDDTFGHVLNQASRPDAVSSHQVVAVRRDPDSKAFVIDCVDQYGNKKTARMLLPPAPGPGAGHLVEPYVGQMVMVKPADGKSAGTNAIWYAEGAAHNASNTAPDPPSAKDAKNVNIYQHTADDSPGGFHGYAGNSKVVLDVDKSAHMGSGLASVDTRVKGVSLPHGDKSALKAKNIAAVAATTAASIPEAPESIADMQQAAQTLRATSAQVGAASRAMNNAARWKTLEVADQAAVLALSEQAGDIAAGESSADDLI